MSDPPAAVDVLYVDGDRSFAATVRTELVEVGERVDVEWVPTVGDATAVLADGRFDCVVTAYTLPDGDGVELAEVARAEDHTLPVVLFADDDHTILTGEVVRGDFADYLAKGADEDRIEALAATARETVAAERTDAPRSQTAASSTDSTREAPREADRFDAAFEAIPYPASHVDIEGGNNVVKTVNSAFESVFGFDRRETVGRSINDLIVPSDGVDSARAIDERVADGELVEAELERVTTDGPRQFLFRAQRFEPACGGAEALGVYVDITDRNRQKRELERYAQIIEAAGDPVYTLYEEGDITYVNRQLASLTGYDTDDLVGEPVTAIMDEADVGRGTELIRELLADPERDRGTLRMRIGTADGREIPTENHIALLPRGVSDGDGFAGTVGVIRDISERVERERRLEEQNERLDAFTGVVGHDLRNPLNVAQGHLGLARDADTPEQRAASFEAVERSLERMEGLIDSLLTLARDGETETELSPVPLARVAEACRPMAETMGGTLAVETDAVVLADRSRLQQLVENLVRNAIEHGGDGVTVRVSDTAEGFAVEDDGPGIPSAVREQVFDTGYSTANDGTGLGLSIVADVAADHDWELAVEERPEGGTRFAVGGVERPD